MMSNQIPNGITFTKWSSVFYLTFLAFTKGVTLNVYVYYEIPLLSPSPPPLSLKDLKNRKYSTHKTCFIQLCALVEKLAKLYFTEKSQDS